MHQLEQKHCLQGSSSFRMMYLPTGAHVIVIGPSDDNLWHGEFNEIDSCFQHLGYLSFHRYYSKPEECKERFERVWGDSPVSETLKDYMRWWDTDRYPSPFKLGNMIENAAAELQSSR